MNILGVYDDEDVLQEALDQVQGKGVIIKDVYTPVPLHHVFESLKLSTRLPYLTFLYGAIGAAVVFGFLYWTSVVNYPLKFGGKPLNSLSFIIIMFVLTILVATVGTFMTFFIRQKLWPGKRASMPDPRTVDDKFVIVVDQPEDMSEEEASRIKNILRESGAVEVNLKDDYND